MTIFLQDLDYKFLVPPKEVYSIKHEDSYIKKGEGKKGIRKIFNNVSFDSFEREKIQEFRAIIQSENIILPSGWNDVEILKFAYSGKFDFKKSLQIMKSHLEWINNPNYNTINQNALSIIKEGIVYISGRGHGFRPIITMNVHKLDLKKHSIDDFILALGFILNIAKKYCFVPYHVENWIIIIETNGAGLTNFPTKVLKKIIELTSINYQATLEKLYILNPSMMLKGSWSIIQGLLDPETASKISMLRKGDLNELLKKASIDQIEERYQGKLPNPTCYWPPYTTLEPNKIESPINIMSSQRFFENENNGIVNNNEAINDAKQKTEDGIDTGPGSNSSMTEKENPITSRNLKFDNDEESIIFSEDEIDTYITQSNLYHCAFTVTRNSKNKNDQNENDHDSSEKLELPAPILGNIIFEDKTVKTPFCGFCRSTTKVESRASVKPKSECQIF